jgi:hypothetical protein
MVAALLRRILENVDSALSRQALSCHLSYPGTHLIPSVMSCVFVTTRCNHFLKKAGSRLAFKERRKLFDLTASFPNDNSDLGKSNFSQKHR